LAKLLNSLEGGPTLLAIRDLTVSQSEPAALPERAEALRIEFTIEGLMFTPQRISTPSAGRTAR
ncbi:MAG TPA: hypothetical protein VJO33_01935, partial [Gemmatimonadaceae bacterium]|nr:hypothetical protein [Gemmatimonadaceae bacterium]